MNLQDLQKLKKELQESVSAREALSLKAQALEGQVREEELLREKQFEATASQITSIVRSEFQILRSKYQIQTPAAASTPLKSSGPLASPSGAVNLEKK